VLARIVPNGTRVCIKISSPQKVIAQKINNSARKSLSVKFTMRPALLMACVIPHKSVLLGG